MTRGRQRLACGGCASQRAFTLLELMLAIVIMAAISMLAYLSFSSVTSAWKRGTSLSDDIHHGDFAMEQLVMALRSAYYPDAVGKGDTYGMITEDEGGGATAADTISWVKLGSSLVGKNSPVVESPHRVKVTIEDDEKGRRGIAVRAWRLLGQPDTFCEQDVAPTFISTKVVGMNIRTAHRKVGDDIDWLDKWDETNRLPTVIEMTLYLEPLEKGENPVEIKRVFSVPAGPLSWRDGKS